MEREIIQKIIEAGNLAPSGSNSQPWKFEVKNNTIKVIGLPEKDHRILNFRNRGTYIAHGALLENMEVTARHLGYTPTVKMFPRDGVFAEISLERSRAPQPADLHGEVARRHTNRRPYKASALSESDKRYLFEEAARFPSCELVFAEGEKLDSIAQKLALDILITFENQLLHKLLFEEILWEEEHQMTRKGLYVKTMEVKPPKSSVFKLMRNWKTARFFSKLKIPRKIYEENTKTIASSGLIAGIVVKDNDADFVDAGKLVENIWLRAAKLNLGCQLVTGILFLWQQANLGDGAIFSGEERNIIDRAYDGLRDAFGAKNGVFALTLRIGHAAPPSAVSYKRPPEIAWE